MAQNPSKSFFKSSGPGWLEAAVTLGGGTLVSALYLGVIGGYQFLWLPILAMACGIIMLYALSYVTLSKSKAKERPFKLVQKNISPTLAWSWLIAAMIANIVFCASQFALATDALEGNLGTQANPFLTTTIIAIVCIYLIHLFSKDGKVSTLIQTLIKMLVAIIVLAFLAVVILLLLNGAIDFKALFTGLLPNPSLLAKPSAAYTMHIESSGSFAQFWTDYITAQQRDIIIGAFGTAVGINMTFLLPYSIYKKKWKKKDRAFAKKDLIIGLLVPFMITASCLIISTASQFHAQSDSIVNDKAYYQVLDKRLSVEDSNFSERSITEQNKLRFNAPVADKTLSRLLAKRSAFDLAEAIEPFLGRWSQFIFGIGILAMALSTMLIHMMINGYAMAEATGNFQSKKWFMIGAAIPAISGLLSPLIWAGSVKAAMVVPASVIATTLLPIAYLAFIFLMNSKKVMGKELHPRRRLMNGLMGISFAVATFASLWALYGKACSENAFEKYFGLIGIVTLFVLFTIGSYSYYKKEKAQS